MEVSWSTPLRALRRVRPIVSLLIIAQFVIPAVLLAVRWQEPTRGQLPFGWQMHTTCWAFEDDTRCR